RRDDGDSQEIRISDRTRLETDRCTFQGLNVTMTSGGEALFRRTLVTGDPGPGLLIWADSEWKGEQNRYEIGSLRVGQTSYTAATFADFQRATNSEAQSSWAERNEGKSESVGANEAVLARLYPAEATKK
ncbi:MAG: hypothetical protein KDL87_16280, partial [Verrucomicrobiae bacterium]|nr:hypothetical protein [Verrucomicrobiae bacterium]